MEVTTYYRIMGLIPKEELPSFLKTLEFWGISHQRNEDDDYDIFNGEKDFRPEMVKYSFVSSSKSFLFSLNFRDYYEDFSQNCKTHSLSRHSELMKVVDSFSVSGRGSTPILR